ncbi:MAG: hypothetical protein AAF456_01380 [Planctomycetota bacterium]
MSRKIVIAVICISICLAIALGLADRETQSLTHLLTADSGNVPALAMYAAVFSAIGLGLTKCLEISGRTA